MNGNDNSQRIEFGSTNTPIIWQVNGSRGQEWHFTRLNHSFEAQEKVSYHFIEVPLLFLNHVLFSITCSFILD